MKQQSEKQGETDRTKSRKARIEFAKTWTVFAPFDAENGNPSSEDLLKVPDQLVLNGKAANPIQIVGSKKVDMQPWLDKKEENGDTAIVYIPFTVLPEKQDSSEQTGEEQAELEAVFGIGADYWFTAWIDGRQVCDTLIDGNGIDACSPNNHKWQVLLKPGTHMLTVKHTRGSGGCLLCIGIPDEDVQCNARIAPEWLAHGIIYQIWLRSFTVEGTLKAAIKRLPDIAELGATIIYLSPISLQDDDPRQEYWSYRQKAFGTNEARNPYRIKDYNQIDPEYGTEGDLQEFIATAHHLGLRVLMDLVYSQTGPTCVLTKDPEFYKRDADGEIVLTPYKFLRLNFDCTRLCEYFWDNMLHWVRDFGVDGFRCDTSDEVPLHFWEEARNRLDKLRPDIVLLAEGHRASNQVKAFDVQYAIGYFRLYEQVVVQGIPASCLQIEWERRHNGFPVGARFLALSDNHDQHRAALVYGEAGASALAVLSFTLDGVPFIYNGQEIDDATPLNLFAHWPIRWDALCLPQTRVKRDFYKCLCNLRRSEATLREGELLWLKNSDPDSVISFVRRTDHDEIVSVINLSNRKTSVQVELPASNQSAYVSLLPGITFGLSGVIPAKLEDKGSAAQLPGSNSLMFELDGFSYFVGKQLISNS